MASVKSLLARAAIILTDLVHDTQWDVYTEAFEVADIADTVPRLYKSQRFGDDDYPSCVSDLFLKIADRDERLALDFVKWVLSRELNLSDNEIISRDPGLFQGLGLATGGVVGVPIIPVMQKKYLNITTLPDDFYVELQGQINKAFAYGILPAVQILSRKFLENLLVDVLRKKYGKGKIEIFYDVKNGRFHSFEVLLKSFRSVISDFAAISSILNDDFIQKINRFRVRGNSSAHTIELDLDFDQVEKDGKDLEYIVKVLVRVINSL